MVVLAKNSFWGASSDKKMVKNQGEKIKTSTCGIEP